MSIQSLYITNVGPFDEIEFEFDSQVNVFTGPNNSGKSSVLWTLGDIVAYPPIFPAKLLRKGKKSTYRISLSGTQDRSLQGHLPVETHDMGYWNPDIWEEHCAYLKEIGYSKFIPALRWSTDFRSQGPKPSQQQKFADQDEILQDRQDPLWERSPGSLARTPNEVFLQLHDSYPELRKRLALFTRDVYLVSDEAVIQKIIQLHYRSFVKQTPVYRDIVDKISEIASEITADFPIKFDGTDEDEGGFYPKFTTIDGPVPLNALSQGTQSIIQWLAHLIIGYAEYYDYPADLAERPGILIIDEIDAHLHPSWQRRIIPTLTKHFPRLQIFCSTHSPLMVAGLEAGQVQLLQRDGNGRVTVSTNETDIAGWTADEILRHFMGVPDPTDIAAEKRLARLQDLQLTRNPTATEAAELEELRQTLSQDLVRSPMSSQLEHFADVLRQVAAESHGDHADTK